MSGLISEEIEKYIELHTSDEGEALKTLDRRTHMDVLMPRMLSGKVQGRFLSILSKAVRPRYILEIGTFTGYSAICLAEGLREGGKLVTIDINEERENIVQSAIRDAGMEDKIETLTGPAAEIIPGLALELDLVFIDADKVNYSLYFDLVIDKIRPGGLILADNVLWSGKVVEEKKDKDTLALQLFNQKVQQDTRVDNVILSVRDGISFIYKK